MNNLCIIPARGGSKRIPRKNIKDFLGKPIIAYSIEVALTSGLFREVMVSTDDSEIAEISLKYGGKIPFMRSTDNSSDYASTIDVIKEVVENYGNLGLLFDKICCIYPAAPFITVDILNKGYNKLVIESRDSVFPIVPFSYSIWRGLRVTNGGNVQMIWPEYKNSRSQDMEKVFHDAGQWYWLSIDTIKNKKSLFTENTASIILNPLQVQDIDNIDDWKIAELKYERIQNSK